MTRQEIRLVIVLQRFRQRISICPRLEGFLPLTSGTGVPAKNNFGKITVPIKIFIWIRPEDFQNIFYKACEKIEGDAGIFEFKSSRTVYRIPLKDILYFEGDNRRVKIVTAGHTYHCYSTLENLFSKINMDQAGFIRLHKSYAVNLRYVATFSVRMVTLFDGSEFTVSAPFKENALRQYEGYISKTGMGRGDTSGE